MLCGLRRSLLVSSLVSDFSVVVFHFSSLKLFLFFPCTTTNMAFHSIRLTLLYGFYSGFINAIIVDAIIGYLYTIAF